jgi:hypothetical protein
VRNYWVGVASREHVLAAVRGGFAQLNHGREAPIRRLKPGDRILYYSPREGMREGASVQAFTAIGEILEGEPRQVVQSEAFHPFRRDVRYFDAQEAPIAPLLASLSFSRGVAAWGQVLRRGTFLINCDDYQLIAAAMQVVDDACDH